MSRPLAAGDKDFGPAEFTNAIFQAGESTQSPIFVQITPIQLSWFEMALTQFANEFWATFEAEKPTVPVALHLNHARDF